MPDPAWPEKLDFWKLVEMATKDSTITSMDHPAVKQVLGLK